MRNTLDRAGILALISVVIERSSPRHRTGRSPVRRRAERRDANEELPGQKNYKSPRSSFILALIPGVIVCLAAFYLYYRTLAPTMLYYDPAGMYDSLMLQVKASVLGIPNPTGYPTYMMLAHLFTYLPIEGGVGYRVNLASAVFGAMAVGVVYFIGRLLTGRVVAALAGAMLFAISRVFWSQAVITEVYTLNALLISLDFLALLLWRKTGRDRYLLIFAFLMGLSLTNHMTSGLVLPAAALFLLLTDWRKALDWRLMLRGTGLFFVGLLPYLYLPIRSAMNPPLDEANPTSPGRFLDLVTGRNFQDRMFAFGWDEMGERISLYAGHLANQFNPLFAIAALIGALGLAYRRDIAALALFGLAYFGWLVYGMQYDIRDYFIYFIPTYMVVCLLVACCFGAILDGVSRVAAAIPRRGLSRNVGLVGAAVASLLMFAALVPGFGKVYADVDMSEDYHGLHIKDAVVRGAAPDSTIVQNGGVMYYMKYVSGDRPDLEVIDPFPAGGWRSQSPLWVSGAVEALGQGRRAYVIFPSQTAERNEYLFWNAGYELVEDESGFFYEVVRRDEETGRTIRAL